MTRSYTGWRKAHHSDPDGHRGEAGRASDGTVGVRGTKLHGNGPTLEFSPAEWASFLDRVRRAA